MKIKKIGEFVMSKRVLIVDDSSIMRKMIRNTLESGNHQIVGEAKNGKDAVTMYKDLNPDLVTMDIAMPDLDGVQSAQKILKSFPEAKIIVVSAQNQQVLVISAVKAGVKNFIIKPIKAEKIKQAISDITN